MFFGVSSDYLLGNDVIVTIKDKNIKNYSVTEEEIIFINELRKNKYLSTVLLEDPLRGIELINKKIG